MGLGPRPLWKANRMVTVSGEGTGGYMAGPASIGEIKAAAVAKACCCPGDSSARNCGDKVLPSASLPVPQAALTGRTSREQGKETWSAESSPNTTKQSESLELRNDS